jgi:hypothetical protein
MQTQAQVAFRPLTGAARDKSRSAGCRRRRPGPRAHALAAASADTSDSDITVVAVRLIVARCEVSYTGRGSTHLPQGVRLLMIKAEGRSSSGPMEGGVP